MQKKSEQKILHTFEFLVAFLLMALTAAVVSANSLTEADTWVLDLLYTLRSPWILQWFSWVTVLGNPSVVIGITAAVLCMLLIQKNTRFAVGFFVAVAGASLTEWIMKIVIERARPSGFSDLLPSSYSFPSGHATASMALYGFITYLLIKAFPRYQVLISLIGVLLIGAIGFSRLYLGVHYPSDVVGGYLLAALWILVGAKVAHILKK